MKLREPELSQNYQYITLTGACGRGGGGRGEERGKVERGANLMKGGTHLELMHSNIFAMKPIQ